MATNGRAGYRLEEANDERTGAMIWRLRTPTQGTLYIHVIHRQGGGAEMAAAVGHADGQEQQLGGVVGRFDDLVAIGRRTARDLMGALAQGASMNVIAGKLRQAFQDVRAGR